MRTDFVDQPYQRQIVLEYRCRGVVERRFREARRSALTEERQGIELGIHHALAQRLRPSARDTRQRSMVDSPVLARRLSTLRPGAAWVPVSRQKTSFAADHRRVFPSAIWWRWRSNDRARFTIVLSQRSGVRATLVLKADE